MAVCKSCGLEITFVNEAEYPRKDPPVWKVYEKSGDKLVKHNCKARAKERKARWVRDHMDTIIETKKLNSEFHEIVK